MSVEQKIVSISMHCCLCMCRYSLWEYNIKYTYIAMMLHNTVISHASKTGIMMFGEKDSEVADVISILRGCGVEHEVFSGAEANRRYSRQFNLPPNFRCVLEKDGGILRANKCVAALQVSHCR